ncbi:hypothetical protein GJ496_005239 [Pomphorhynchus laevis]|nr:hypothetical protein GJ496_005239 [Pomphorhynchus laevis]
MDGLRNQPSHVNKDINLKTESLPIKVDPIQSMDDAISARSDLSSADEDGLMSQLYNSVKSHNVGLGIRPFLRLPSKRMYPDYFVEIKMPISMLEIKRKIKNAQYIHISDILQDFNLMFANAMHYNQEDSEIWKTAKEMLNFVQEKFREMSDEHEKLVGSNQPSAAKRPKLSKRRSDTNSKTPIVNDNNKLSQSNILKLFSAIKESWVNGRKPADTFIRSKNPGVSGLDEIDISEIEMKVESKQRNVLPYSSVVCIRPIATIIWYCSNNHPVKE